MARQTRTTRGAVNPPRRGLQMAEQPTLAEPKSKRDRFVERVNTRVGNIITSVDELCKIADRAYYDFTSDDIDKVLGALREQVTRVEHSFRAGKKVSTFHLE